MIVPSRRLLIWFALVVLPFAILGGVEPAATAISILAIGLFLLLVMIDAFLAGGRLNGIDVELTPMVRATQERPFNIGVRVRNPSQQARKLRLALAFPTEITPAAEDITVDLPAGSEWSVFDWSCSSTARGKFPIRSARMEATSPVGFWARWKTLPAAR